MQIDELTAYYSVGRRLQHVQSGTSTLTLNLPNTAYFDTVVAVDPLTGNVLSVKKKETQVTVNLPQAQARVTVQGHQPLEGLLQEISPDSVALQTQAGLQTISNYESVVITQR